MTKHELDRILHRATKFPDPKPRVAALRSAFEAIEESILHQSDQFAVRAQARMEKRGMDPDSIELELHILRNSNDQLLPRVFRGGFLVSLWGVFESGIKDVAEYARLKLNLPFGLQDLRAADFLDQTEKFFKATLQVAAFPDKYERAQVVRLRGFRNALSHHDGNLKELPKSLRQQEGVAYQKFKDLHHEFAMPTAGYNSVSIDLIQKVSSELANAVFEKLHPRNERDA